MFDNWKKSVKKEKQLKPTNVKLIFYCIIAAAALYAILIVTEKSLIKQEEQILVYVAVDDVPEMIFITEENFDNYFAQEKRPISTLPEGTVTDVELIMESFTKCSIYKNQTLIAGMFKSEKSYIDNIENPVEVSFTAGSIAQTVGGVLRAGDLINIWSVSSVSENGVKKTSVNIICEGAYVSRAFTSTGVEVKRDSKDEASTTVINIIIPSEYEKAFNEAISTGSLRISRIVDGSNGEVVLEEIEEEINTEIKSESDE